MTAPSATPVGIARDVSKVSATLGGLKAGGVEEAKVVELVTGSQRPGATPNAPPVDQIGLKPILDLNLGKPTATRARRWTSPGHRGAPPSKPILRKPSRKGRPFHDR